MPVAALRLACCRSRSVCCEINSMKAIAKTDRATGETRSLIGHSLDVAHCVHAMLTQGVARSRLGAAVGISLTDIHAERLAVLAGLHDFGKSTNGFQDRINGRCRGTGHVAEAVAVVNRSEERRVGKECRSRWSTYH